MDTGEQKNSGCGHSTSSPDPSCVSCLSSEMSTLLSVINELLRVGMKVDEKLDGYRLITQMLLRYTRHDFACAYIQEGEECSCGLDRVQEIYASMDTDR